MDIQKIVAANSNTNATDWEFIDGPESGVGVDYWLANRRESLEAYVCVDQGEVISCEIQPQAEPARPNHLPLR